MALAVRTGRFTGYIQLFIYLGYGRWLMEATTKEYKMPDYGVLEPLDNNGCGFTATEKTFSNLDERGLVIGDIHEFYAPLT